jgi:hypothetical protein
MHRLFSSPIYTGGGGARHRLQSEVPLPRVWHDAAYFAPLLWYYHQACHEEICGLRHDEVIIDHDVPHFWIQDNDVRGRDGELAGEKRMARRRALPLHPELIRLGFLDYVKAVRAEGHVALFPELYVNRAKRGGAQFYDAAWCHIVEWLGDGMEIPRNEKGKGADIHSIRSLGASRAMSIVHEHARSSKEVAQGASFQPGSTPVDLSHRACPRLNQPPEAGPHKSGVKGRIVGNEHVHVTEFSGEEVIVEPLSGYHCTGDTGNHRRNCTFGSSRMVSGSVRSATLPF